MVYFKITAFAFMICLSSPAQAETPPTLEEMIQLVEQTEHQLAKWNTLADNIKLLGDVPITAQLSAEHDNLMTETNALVKAYATEVRQADTEVLNWLRECQTQMECLARMDNLDMYLEMRKAFTEAQALLESVVFRETFMIHTETVPD